MNPNDLFLKKLGKKCLHLEKKKDNAGGKMALEELRRYRLGYPRPRVKKVLSDIKENKNE